MSTLSPPPINAPFLDARGFITRPWLQWLRSLHGRVGGSTAPTPPEVEIQQALELWDSGSSVGEALREHGARDIADLIEYGPVFVPSSEVGLDLDSRPVALDSELWSGNAFSRGTFTVTLTGFTTTVTGTARYVKMGPFVLLFLPEMTATSNATTMTATGMPAALQPTQVAAGLFRGVDSGSQASRYWRLNVSTTIDFFTGPTFAGWTASGTKGIQSGFWIPYAQL